MATCRIRIEYKGDIMGVTMNRNLKRGYSGYPFKLEDEKEIIDFTKDRFRKNWGVPFTLLIDRDGVKESIEVLT